MTNPHIMKHRTVSVLFLCAVSMMGCFMWFGRLNPNLSSTDKPTEMQERTVDPLTVEGTEKELDADTSTPPPYLFTSDRYSDDDEAKAEEDNNKQGERVRTKSVDTPKEKQSSTSTPPVKAVASSASTPSTSTVAEPSKTSFISTAKSLDASLQTISDAPAADKIDYTNRPKLVWLMSYPNSGTSYTMTMVARASQRAIASNYGKEVTEPGMYSTPLYPGHWNGPYYQPKDDKPLPRDYILVKTHCGGRCVTCGPDVYITNQFEFLYECSRGSGFIPQNRELEESNFSSASMDMSSTDDASPDFQIVHYDASLVTKAVHLYRNIFHNIVSRFHLERKHWGYSQKTSLVEKYTNDPKGFRRWCRDLNKEYGPNPGEKSILDDEIVELMQNVPCHGEVYKYVQWHNMAHAITSRSMKATLVLHYENYENKWNATATQILDFLHLEMEGTKKEFHARHDYDPYFSLEQRNATKILAKRLAEEAVWKQLERYFD